MAEDVQRVAKAITPASAGKDIAKCTRVIREGPAIWSGRKENEAVHLFLLNNILLLTEAAVDEKYKLIYLIKLKAEFRVPEVADPVTWKLITPKKEFDFVCSSPEDKTEWFRCIRYTMEGTVPPVFVNGVWDPLGALLPDELTKFQELKARVQAVVEERSYDDAIRNWLTDHTYLRFLKARNWVVEDAFKQLDDTLKWRDEFKPLSITIQDVDREAESGKFIVTDAKDKLGRPIVYFKTALDKTPFDDVRLKHMVFLLEEIALRADASRYATEKSVWFFDFTDRDFKSNQIQPAIKCSIDFIKTFQAYYPETLGKVFLINSPAVFQLIWKGVKGFIDPITQGKVNFYKKSELQETMEDFFDVDNLDEQFGGRLKIDWDYEEWKKTLRHGNTGSSGAATTTTTTTTSTSSESTEAPAATE